VSRASLRKNGPPEPDLEDQILDAVDRLLARFGYRDMTMEDLALEVGIDKTSIYLSFRTKEDLLLSHIDRIVRQVVEAMEAIAEAEGAPGKKLQEMLVTRVMLRFDSVQHYPESLGDIVRDLRFPLLERRPEYFQSEARPLTKVIREGLKLNYFRAVEPLVTVAALLEATNSLLPFNLTGRELGMRQEVRRRVLDITDLLIHGVLATQPRKKRE
jgi:AcrR family transcriptional regulator